MFEIGQQAPDFTLTSDEGTEISLSDYRGKRVLVFFYPKAFTGGCTTQACGLRDGFPQIEAGNGVVLGISPDGATAAYRVGDGATNIITPLMVYFPLILVFAQRWKKDFGLGSLTAMMIPYSIWLLISGVILMMVWIFLGLDLGPGAPAQIPIPGAS